MNDPTCSVDGCGKPIRTVKSGLCEMHYYRQRRWGDLNITRKPQKYEPGTLCSIGECGQAVFSLGFCSRHYAKHRKYGDAEHPPQPRGPASRPRPQCSIDGCDRKTVANLLCQNHYVKNRRRIADPIVAATFKARVSRGNFRRRVSIADAEMLDVTSSDWLRLIRRYRGCCAYCGTPDNELTLEHIIPLARGGRHAIGNILPVCGSCNSSKRDKLLIEWRAWKKSVAA